jgi:hypothetical protein
MKKRYLGMKACSQSGQECYPLLLVAGGAAQRHQNVPRMRFAHVHDPHDCKISRDAPQQSMDRLLLQGGAVALTRQQGIKDQISLFSKDTFGQQAGNQSHLGYAGNGYVVTKGSSKKMFLMAFSMVKNCFAGILCVGCIQNQPCLAGCSQSKGIAGCNCGSAVLIDYRNDGSVTHGVPGAAG